MYSRNSRGVVVTRLEVDAYGNQYNQPAYAVADIEEFELDIRLGMLGDVLYEGEERAYFGPEFVGTATATRPDLED